MKTPFLTIAGCFLLPFVSEASLYTDSLERLSVSNPEFVLYTDLQSDFDAAGGFLTEAYLAYLSTGPEGIPPIPVDFKGLFGRLGFSGVQSLVATSEANPEFGFTNQMMVTFEEAPAGVFLLAGDTNQPFSIHQSAPADAQLVAEMNLNGNALFQIVRGLVIDMMGPLGEGMIEAQMNQPLFENGPTLADVVNRLNTRIQIAIKPSFEGPSDLPPGMDFFNWLSVIHIADIADLFEQVSPMVEQSGFTLSETDAGKTWSFAVPAGPMPISVFVQTMPGSNDLMVSFKEGSREWFLGSGPKIDTAPDFMKSIAGLPQAGLSFWYTSEEMSRFQIENLDTQLPPAMNLQPVLAVVKDFLMTYTGKQAGVSFLEEDAYRVTSFQPTSYKTNIALAGVVVPMSIAASFAATAEGAMEVPADEEAGEESEEPLPESSPVE